MIQNTIGIQIQSICRCGGCYLQPREALFFAMPGCMQLLMGCAAWQALHRGWCYHHELDDSLINGHMTSQYPIIQPSFISGLQPMVYELGFLKV